MVHQKFKYSEEVQHHVLITAEVFRNFYAGGFMKPVQQWEKYVNWRVITYKERGVKTLVACVQGTK
jgi:hypothetical protein